MLQLSILCNNSELDRRIMKRINKCLWLIQVACSYLLEAIIPKREAVAFFDPSLDTENLGDNIISHYCRKALSEYMDCESVYSVQTHYLPDSTSRHQLLGYGKKIVFGTNLISPEWDYYSIWAMPRSLLGYRHTIAMGVGSRNRSDYISNASKLVYRSVFSKQGIHSVRDSYTEQLFHKVGIQNVVNTGCPTLWNLTPEHCSNIPRKKAHRVICTITDYDRDPIQDTKMLSILKKEYDQVYIWVQGKEDLEYINMLVADDSVVVVDRSLEKYTALLVPGEIDYVGTRLHAGICALNHGVRSLVISIDNRAEEMGNDFHLPVISRESIEINLREWINGEQETRLNLPWENIQKWKSQFAEKEG